MDVYSIFSRNLKFYRRKKKLSRAGLSELSGVPADTIKRMEREKMSVKLSDIEALAKSLDVPAYYLFMTETIID